MLELRHEFIKTSIAADLSTKDITYIIEYKSTTNKDIIFGPREGGLRRAPL